MRTTAATLSIEGKLAVVGMKPLSERDENHHHHLASLLKSLTVGMKPLSERDENSKTTL